MALLHFLIVDRLMMLSKTWMEKYVSLFFVILVFLSIYDVWNYLYF